MDPIAGKRHRARTFVFLMTLGLAVPGRALAGQSAESFPQVVAVEKTYDGRPFEYRIESRAQRSGYSVYALTYPSPVVTEVPQNNTVPAEYYLPDGIAPGDPKRPAVISMHILDGDFVLARMACSMLASHGIPSLMFKLPYYGERGFPEGPEAMADNPELFVGAMSQGLEDVRRTIDVLASRPEIDRERIGITGISLGGIVAGAASGRDERLWRAMLILAGGDLRTIIHHARETRDLSRAIGRLSADEQARIHAAVDEADPLRHAERVRARAAAGRVLMVNAGSDEVIPRSCTDQLASALGLGDRVVWLDGLGHYTAMAELPRVLQTMVDFFGEDLPAGATTAPPVARKPAPVEILASLLHQASTILIAEPDEGRCHFADLAVSVEPEGEKTIEARLKLIRGSKGRFRIECDLPWTGDVALGQGAWPWMCSGSTRVFRGALADGATAADPLSFVRPEHVMRLRMVAGAAAGVAVAPHILNQWIAVAEAASEGAPPMLRIAVQEGEAFRDRAELSLRDDLKTPERLTFDAGNVKGTIDVRGWQTNTVAHDAMFAPPAEVPVQEVDAADLYRMFAAMFNFAMESAR